MDSGDFRYWAFISYSHADKAWAEWLHRSLESYRTPRRLAGRATPRGTSVPHRIFPVFRDREELPSSADLGENINAALRQSRFLVAICSPRAATSRWVNEEILTYRRHGGGDRILALIVDGEPNAAEKGRTDECFPEALRFDGERRVEPIAADARPGGDGKPAARLKIVAGILGVGFDELRRRERQRARRRAAGWAAAVALLGLAFAGLWFFQERERDRHEREIRSAALTDRARSLVREGRDDEALATLAAAVRLDATNRIAATMIVALVDRRAWACRRIAAFRVPGRSGSVRFSPDARQVVTTADDRFVRVWNADTGLEEGPPLEHPDILVFAAIREDEIVTVCHQGARVWGLADRAPRCPMLPLPGVTSNTTLAALSPDGRRLFTGYERRFMVWGLATRTPMGALAWDLGASIDSAEFSEDGSVLRILSTEGERIEWSVDEARVLSRAPPDPEWSLGKFAFGDGTYSEVCFSRDGRRAATRSWEDVEVWDAIAERRMIEPIPERDGDSDFMDVDLAADGRRLVTIAEDATVEVWNVDAARPSRADRRHSGAIRSIGFSSDGRLVATASDDGTVRLWDAVGLKPVCRPFNHLETVETVGFARDGASIVSVSKWEEPASSSRTAHEWILADGSYRAVQSGIAGYGADVRYSADGRRLGWIDGGELRVVDLQDGRSDGFGGGGYTRMVGWDDRTGITVVLVAPGRLVARDAATGAPKWTFDGRAGGALLHPDAGALLYTSDGGRVGVVDAATGTGRFEPVRHGDGSPGASFDAGGGRFVTVHGCTARVWDAATGRPLTEWLEHPAGVHRAEFSPDGAHLLVVGDFQKSWAWDLGAGKRSDVGQWVRESYEYLPLGFSPDGRWLLTTTAEKTIGLTPPARIGEPAMRLEHETAVNRGIWSDDGSRLAVTHADGNLSVWSAFDAPKRSFRIVHDAPLTNVTFDPAGGRLLAVDESVVFVWDLSTGEPAIPAIEHPAGVGVAVFDPSGARILTSCDDGWARQWDARTGREIAPALPLEGEYAWANYESAGRVVVGRSSTRVVAWDADGGAQRFVIPIERAAVVQEFAFAADSHAVAGGCWGGRVLEWELGTARRLSETDLKLPGESIVAVETVGARAVAATSEGSVWMVDPAAGGVVWSVRPISGTIERLVASPAGDRVVACAGSESHLLDAATGRSIGERFDSPACFRGCCNTLNERDV